MYEGERRGSTGRRWGEVIMFSICVGFQGMGGTLTTSSSSIPYSKQSASNCSSAAEKGTVRGTLSASGHATYARDFKRQMHLLNVSPSASKSLSLLTPTIGIFTYSKLVFG